MLPLPGTAGRGLEIERRLRERGVAVFHSDRFSVRPGNPKSFLRVSLSSTPSLARFRRALELLSAAFPVSSAAPPVATRVK